MENTKITFNDNGTEIVIDKKLKTGTLLDIKDGMSEMDILLVSIKNQTNLTKDDDIRKLDIETFEKIKDIIQEMLKTYLEKKNLKLDSLENDGTEKN